MIEKHELENLAYYRGACGRGPHVMMWSEEEDKFLYIRNKFNQWYVDTMHHFADVKHTRLAGFRPVEKIEEVELIHEDRWPATEK